MSALLRAITWTYSCADPKCAGTPTPDWSRLTVPAIRPSASSVAMSIPAVRSSAAPFSLRLPTGAFSGLRQDSPGVASPARVFPCRSVLSSAASASGGRKSPRPEGDRRCSQDRGRRALVHPSAVLHCFIWYRPPRLTFHGLLCDLRLQDHRRLLAAERGREHRHPHQLELRRHFVQFPLQRPGPARRQQDVAEAPPLRIDTAVPLTPRELHCQLR